MTPASYARVAALCASGRHVTGRARRVAGGFERRRGPGSPKSLTASRGAAPSCLWGRGAPRGPKGRIKRPNGMAQQRIAHFRPFSAYGEVAPGGGGGAQGGENRRIKRGHGSAQQPIFAPSLLKRRHGVEGARSTPLSRSGGAARRRSSRSRNAGEEGAVSNGVKAALSTA